MIELHPDLTDDDVRQLHRVLRYATSREPAAQLAEPYRPIVAYRGLRHARCLERSERRLNHDADVEVLHGRLPRSNYLRLAGPPNRTAVQVIPTDVVCVVHPRTGIGDHLGITGSSALSSLSRTRDNDEFPFKSSLEGWGAVRIEEVLDTEQDCQGGTIRQAYRRYNIQEGDEYVVIIIHYENIPDKSWDGQPYMVTTCDA